MTLLHVIKIKFFLLRVITALRSWMRYWKRHLANNIWTAL